MVSLPVLFTMYSVLCIKDTFTSQRSFLTMNVERCLFLIELIFNEHSVWSSKNDNNSSKLYSLYLYSKCIHYICAKMVPYVILPKHKPNVCNIRQCLYLMTWSYHLMKSSPSLVFSFRILCLWRLTLHFALDSLWWNW